MGKCKVFPVRNIKACMGNSGMAPLILNLGITRRTVVELQPGSLYTK